MSTLPDAVAVAASTVNGRSWFYTNYHCNLECSYCLTESGPTVRRRELDADAILERAAEAKRLGFTGFGVTGGEPFIRRTWSQQSWRDARARQIVERVQLPL